MSEVAPCALRSDILPFTPEFILHSTMYTEEVRPTPIGMPSSTS